jgi:ABC-type amino acid transport substrate-binding protein
LTPGRIEECECRFQQKGNNVKLLKLSLLGLALVASSLNASQPTPNCGDDLSKPLIVGMDFCNGATKWEKFSNGVLSGFDVQIACQLATHMGFTGVQFVNIDTSSNANAIFDAINAGKVNVGISHISIPTDPASFPTGIAFVKYADFPPSQTTQGIGIALSIKCCQLYANIAAVIKQIAANGTLKQLADEFGITPDTLTPANLTPADCAGTAADLPARNAIGNFILQLCLETCDATNLVNAPASGNCPVTTAA